MNPNRTIYIMALMVLLVQNISAATNISSPPGSQVVSGAIYSANQTNTTNEAKEASNPKDNTIVSKPVDSTIPFCFVGVLLTVIGVLLSVLTLLFALAAGIGIKIILTAFQEQKKIDGLLRELEEKQNTAHEGLKELFDEMRHKLKDDQHLFSNKMRNDGKEIVEAFKITVLGTAQLQRAKRELENALVDSKPNVDKVYAALQKTIAYPDADCLRLYAIALTKLEGNIDIARLVRNGILQYSRSPETASAHAEDSNLHQQSEEK